MRFKLLSKDKHPAQLARNSEKYSQSEIAWKRNLIHLWIAFKALSCAIMINAQTSGKRLMVWNSNREKGFTKHWYVCLKALKLKWGFNVTAEIQKRKTWSIKPFPSRSSRTLSERLRSSESLSFNGSFVRENHQIFIWNALRWDSCDVLASCSRMIAIGINSPSLLLLLSFSHFYSILLSAV